MRFYPQVQQWRGVTRLNPVDWAWRTVDSNFIPIMTDLPAATKELLKIIIAGVIQTVVALDALAGSTTSSAHLLALNAADHHAVTPVQYTQKVTIKKYKIKICHLIKKCFFFLITKKSNSCFKAFFRYFIGLVYKNYLNIVLLNYYSLTYTVFLFHVQLSI